MPSAYDWNQGLTSGVGGFFQGMRERRAADEDDRRIRMEEQRLARQQKMDEREDEEYRYRQGLRPLQEQTVRSGLESQQKQSQLQQVQINEALRKAEEEGAFKSLQYLSEGMYDEATRHSNSVGQDRGGTFQPDSIEPYDPKTGRGYVLAVSERGEEKRINPRQMLDALNKMKQAQQGPLRGRDRFSFESKGVGDYETGKFTPYPGEGGMTGEAGSPTENFRRYQEMLRLGYAEPLARAQAYGFIEKTTDPLGFGAAYTDIGMGQDLGTIGRVTSPYQRNPNYGISQPQQSEVDFDLERRMAEKDVRSEMGWKDYIPFNEPSPQDVDKRFAQRQAMRGGLTQEAAPPSQPSQSGAMESLPPPQASKGRKIADDQGRVFTSDGQWWYDEDGNAVDAQGNPIQVRRSINEGFGIR